jgi:hypothetical protein
MKTDPEKLNIALFGSHTDLLPFYYREIGVRR